MSFTVRAVVSGNAAKDIRRDARSNPAILARALSGLAYQARLDEQVSMKRELDRPKRFTLNAVMYQKANTRTLKSAVYINPKNDYLHRVVRGGVRLPKVKSILIPGSKLRTDASGNLSRTRRRRLLSNPKTFRMRSRKGNDVLMTRQGKKLIFIGTLKKRTLYRSGGYWDFYGQAVKSYDRRFNRLFIQAYDRSLRARK